MGKGKGKRVAALWLLGPFPRAMELKQVRDGVATGPGARGRRG
jgi:hypothetical protein